MGAHGGQSSGDWSIFPAADPIWGGAPGGTLIADARVVAQRHAECKALQALHDPPYQL